MRAVAERMYEKLHEDKPWHDGKFQIWGEKYSSITPWHYKDGVTIYLARTNENPDDKFTTDVNAKPLGL